MLIGSILYEDILEGIAFTIVETRFRYKSNYSTKFMLSFTKPTSPSICVLSSPISSEEQFAWISRHSSCVEPSQEPPKITESDFDVWVTYSKMSGHQKSVLTLYSTTTCYH